MILKCSCRFLSFEFFFFLISYMMIASPRVSSYIALKLSISTVIFQGSVCGLNSKPSDLIATALPLHYQSVNRVKDWSFSFMCIFLKRHLNFLWAWSVKFFFKYFFQPRRSLKVPYFFIFLFILNIKFLVFLVKNACLALGT